MPDNIQRIVKNKDKNKKNDKVDKPKIIDKTNYDDVLWLTGC